MINEEKDEFTDDLMALRSGLVGSLGTARIRLDGIGQKRASTNNSSEEAHAGVTHDCLLVFAMDVLIIDRVASLHVDSAHVKEYQSQR